MDCRLIKLNNGDNFSNVEVYNSSKFDGFIEIVDVKGKVRIVNKNIVTIICPDNEAENEKAQESINNFCKIING